jgi:2-keto-4-pentenoate hydratase/2-oxohepta-3-ene-1,7-dioic acid hydratase in catechol pathway
MQRGNVRNTLMIWCRFQKNNIVTYGIVEGDYVTAVDGDPFTEHQATASKFRLNEVKLLVPVIPPTFYAIGSNYRNHVEGRAKTKGTEPKFYDTPRVGYRANSALIATNETIVKPKDAGEHFEYEGELVAVIGRKVRNVTPQEATRCIFGWTIGNDVTERDWQKQDPTNLRGKNADTFKPMGPWIVTGIEPSAMFTQVRLNGMPLHTFPTGNMLFSPGEVISAISKYNTLSPGDVVWLGTDEVPQSLVPGVTIEIEINGIGVLRNRVAAEA